MAAVEPDAELLVAALSLAVEEKAAGSARRWAMRVPSGRTRMTEVWVSEADSKLGKFANSRPEKITLEGWDGHVSRDLRGQQQWGTGGAHTRHEHQDAVGYDQHVHGLEPLQGWQDGAV